jgi:hypothetical protein
MCSTRKSSGQCPPTPAVAASLTSVISSRHIGLPFLSLHLASFHEHSPAGGQRAIVGGRSGGVERRCSEDDEAHAHRREQRFKGC